jgi:hypothetical protein
MMMVWRIRRVAFICAVPGFVLAQSMLMRK